MYSEHIERMSEILKLRNYSSRTVNAYCFHAKKFFEFANVNPKFIRTKQIEKYIAHLQQKGLNAASINLAISAVKFYYDNVMRRKMFYNITRLKQEDHIVECLSKDEVQRIIDSCSSPRQKMIVIILYSSGLRVSEAVNLIHDNLDIKRKQVFVKAGKGKKDRISILSDKFIEEYKIHLASMKNFKKEELLFKGARGKYSIKTIQAIVKQAAKKAGLRRRVYPHLLRKSFATHLSQQGISILKIQLLLGHADISTTTRYINKSYVGIQGIRSPLDN